jgi:hypothetical protein
MLVCYLKFVKDIITTVMLSRVFFLTDSESTRSTASAQVLWGSKASTLFSSLVDYKLVSISSQIRSMISLLVSLSNIPSQPIMINSCSPFITLNYLMSGSAIITPGWPPKNLSLASISPKVLETDSLPGRTLCGPVM